MAGGRQVTYNRFGEENYPVGSIVEHHLRHQVETGVVPAISSQQTATLTFTAANATVYTFQLGTDDDNLITFTYTSDANATATEIATGFQDLIRLNSIALGLVAPIVTGSTLVLTEKNVVFVLRESDSNIAVVNVPRVVPPSFSAGQFVLLDQNDEIIMPNTSSLAQRVYRITVSGTAAVQQISVVIKDNLRNNTRVATYITTAGATATANATGVRNAMRNILPDNNYTIDSTGGLVTISGNAHGYGFEISSDHSDLTVAGTSIAMNTDITNYRIGFATFNYGSSGEFESPDHYRAGDEVPIFTRDGGIILDPDGTVLPTSFLFYDVIEGELSVTENSTSLYLNYRANKRQNTNYDFRLAR